MSEEPSYPKDASVDGGAVEGGAVEGGAASEAAERAASVKTVDPSRKRPFRTGVAVGIGSAAIVAALLYANRKR